jgi:Fic family protein
MTEEVISTSAIEGEDLPMDQVRSSIARKLGLDVDGLVSTSKSVDGIVNVLMDATLHYDRPISAERLHRWHRELFYEVPRGSNPMEVGKWRTGINGPMQVISGRLGREKVHFQAPDADRLPQEMSSFISWFNDEDQLEPILKAAVAGLWFVTIHPFEDGNGRIGRALTDMLLARSDTGSQRFYSMSATVKECRAGYYNILEKTQNSISLDITEWMVWFLNSLEPTIGKTKKVFERTIKKVEFFEAVRTIELNARQLKVLGMLFEDFEGEMTSTKWAKLTNSSQDTAHRDILDLIAKGLLEKSASQGRSTHYKLSLEQYCHPRG